MIRQADNDPSCTILPLLGSVAEVGPIFSEGLISEGHACVGLMAMLGHFRLGKDDYIWFVFLQAGLHFGEVCANASDVQN